MCHQCLTVNSANDNEPYWLHAHVEHKSLTTNASRSVIEDPTRLAGVKRRAIAELRKRLKGARKDVIALFNSIPYRVITVNRDNYVYELSPSALANINQTISDMVDSWLETSGGTKPVRWFFDDFILQPARSGTIESLNRTSMLATQARYPQEILSSLDVQRVLMSEPYRRRIELLEARTFNEMKGFTAQTKTDLSRVLSETIAKGKTSATARREIRDRFNVSASRAARIARTEISNAHITARLDEQKRSRDELGIDVRVAHRSALSPTTRHWHAARHGRIYTIEDQEEWWETGGNRINCMCGIAEVVFGSNGKPYDQGLLDKLEKQRKAFISS
jgi:SPP1 gp7 family putative phage head morphogenesis protein